MTTRCNDEVPWGFFPFTSTPRNGFAQSLQQLYDSVLSLTCSRAKRGQTATTTPPAGVAQLSARTCLAHGRVSRRAGRAGAAKFAAPSREQRAVKPPTARRPTRRQVGQLAARSARLDAVPGALEEPDRTNLWADASRLPESAVASAHRRLFAALEVSRHPPRAPAPRPTATLVSVKDVPLAPGGPG